ncbi:MAG: gamma-glutamylcyclotransferase [Beijerinckiaceae bacterium]
MSDPLQGHDFWVFGYGSLMWRPDFPFVEKSGALLHGLHRSLCVRSHVHRGTPERPGLVMGLDRGGACHGIAFRVADADRLAVLDTLRAREQVTMVYRESVKPVRLGDARRVLALTYVVDRAHKQYAGALPREAQLAAILGAAGKSGPNPDYVLNTQAHLDEMGVHDATLVWLAAALRAAAAPITQPDQIRSSSTA